MGRKGGIIRGLWGGGAGSELCERRREGRRGETRGGRGSRTRGNKDAEATRKPEAADVFSAYEQMSKGTRNHYVV